MSEVVITWVGVSNAVFVGKCMSSKVATEWITKCNVLLINWIGGCVSGVTERVVQLHWVNMWKCKSLVIVHILGDWVAELISDTVIELMFKWMH